MKIPLYYQMTEYDCGPISLLNGISYLFERENIPPEIPKIIVGVCLDSYDMKGEYAKKGTSQNAMRYLCFWLNQFSTAKQFPVFCEYLSGAEVAIDHESHIINALQKNAVTVLRLDYGGDHYVLLTDSKDDTVNIFDPYLDDTLLYGNGIEKIFDSPYCNRRLSFDTLNGNGTYGMCGIENRDAVILHRTV